VRFGLEILVVNRRGCDNTDHDGRHDRNDGGTRHHICRNRGNGDDRDE